MLEQLLKRELGPRKWLRGVNMPRLSALVRLAGRHAGSIGALGLSTALTLLALRWMGYDFRSFSSAFIGDGLDTLHNASIVAQALDNLLHRPFDLGYGTFFYGEASPLSYTLVPYGIAVAVLPVYLITQHNIVLTYNLYFISTFALTAWTAYLLVRYLLKAPRPASVLVGLMVAFAQYRFLHHSHINVLSNQFFLLSLYCFHRLLDTPRPRWAVGLAVVFWFTLNSGSYQGAIFLVSGLVILLYTALRRSDKMTPRFLLHLGGASLLGILLNLPFVAFRFANPVFRTGRHIEDIVEYSATPLSWFAGNSLLYFHVTPFRGEATLFIGFVPLALAVVAWRFRNRPGVEQEDTSERALNEHEVVGLYTAITLLGYVLTLGPSVRINDTPVAPLPYLLLTQLPGFSQLRVSARFIIMAVTGTAVLSAYSLTLLSRRVKGISHWVVFATVAALLTIELVPYNGSASDRIFDAILMPAEARLLAPRTLERNSPLNEWLAEQPPGSAPMMHYPFAGDAAYRYWWDQLFHDQPMLNGMGASFAPDWYYAFDWEAFPDPATLYFLQERGVRYIIVHYDLLSNAERMDFEHRWAELQEARGDITLVKDFDEVAVYEVPTSIVSVEFDEHLKGTGWAGPETHEGRVSFRWMNQTRATLQLPLVPDDEDFVIQFGVLFAMTDDILDSLSLTVNGEPVELSSEAGRDGTILFWGRIPAEVAAGSGESLELVFEVDHLERPSALGDNDDERLLGVAFDWLEVVPARSSSGQEETGDAAGR